MFSTFLRSFLWVTAGMAGVATALATNTDRSTAQPATPVAPPPRVVTAGDDNPRVKPGLVNWHETVADAEAAAQKSGRPVLVFHMMGQLDRQFC